MAKITKATTLYVVKICAVLLIITMCVAFLLSFVNAITKDTIAANDAAKISKALGGLFPDAAAPEATNVEGDFGDIVTGFYEVKDGDVLVGYYADVAPVGFKGAVNLMVGLDIDGKVVGVEVISHGETVGIGDVIEEDSFRSKFIGREGSLSYKKGASESEVGVIDGHSGATYSSKAVIAGVDAAFGAYKTMKGGN